MFTLRLRASGRTLAWWVWIWNLVILLVIPRFLVGWEASVTNYRVNWVRMSVWLAPARLNRPGFHQQMGHEKYLKERCGHWLQTAGVFSDCRLSYHINSLFLSLSALFSNIVFFVPWLWYPPGPCDPMISVDMIVEFALWVWAALATLCRSAPPLPPPCSVSLSLLPYSPRGHR